MHQVMADIITDAIFAKAMSEEYFCKEILHVTNADWTKWKAGKMTFSAEQMQKIKSLFSDYEWMLVQKILRQTVLFPEKRNYAVSEYKRLKTMIAKNWVKAGAIVELITQKRSNNKTSPTQNRAFIDMKISLEYGEWGYDDILIFRLPARVQKQLEASQVDLLEWVNDNLTETYLAEESKEINQDQE